MGYNLTPNTQQKLQAFQTNREPITSQSSHLFCNFCKAPSRKILQKATFMLYWAVYALNALTLGQNLILQPTAAVYSLSSVKMQTCESSKLPQSTEVKFQGVLNFGDHVQRKRQKTGFVCCTVAYKSLKSQIIIQLLLFETSGFYKLHCNS